MKIALITDDRETISRHFGRAGHYLVMENEYGKEVSREMHDKHDHQGASGTGAESHGKPMSMAETISDGKALICGGMGIMPIVTQERKINAALKTYLQGNLEDHTEMLH